MNSKRSHWPIVILSTFSTVFSLLLPLVLVRVLTPEEVGHFKIFFLYLTMVPAFAFTTGIMSGLAYWAGQSNDSRRSSSVKASSTLVLLLAFIFAATILAVRHSLSAALSWSETQTLLFAGAVIGSIAGTFFEEAAIATGRIWTGALFYSGFELLRTMGILMTVLYFRSLTAVLEVHTTFVLIKVAISYLYGYKLNLVSVMFERNAIADVWRYAFPVSLAWVFGIFVGFADQFILSRSISTADFALYSIGCLSIAPLLIFEHSITRVLIPQMSEAFSQQQPKRAAILYQAAVENLGFLLIPAVTGLILFASPIIELLYTSRYSDAARYLQLYAFTYLLLIVPYDALARARGHANWILNTFIVFSVVSLSLAYLFTRQWGPIGALSAILFTGVSIRLYAIRYFGKETDLTVQQFFPIESLMQYSLVCALLAIVVLIMKSHFTNSHLWFLVCGSGFALSYLTIALPLKNRHDRERTPLRGVLIVTQSLNIGGLEKMIFHLSEQLQAEKRWMVRVLAYDQLKDSPQSLLSKFSAKGIHVEAFKKAPGFSIMVIVRILKSIYRNEIRIVHSHDLGGLLYAVLAKLCCFGRVTLVHTQHSFIHLEHKARYQLYEKLLTRFVDKLSVVSEDTRKTYVKLGICSEKIFLIHNGVKFPKAPLERRPERIRQRQNLLEHLVSDAKMTLQQHVDDFWILYIARFFPGKGQQHALALWSALEPELRNRSILCFVGPESATGQYNLIRDQIAQTPDAARVCLVGPSSEPQQWLSVGDIFLSCSEFEGMPLGPLEAVGAGLPTLLSDIPGHEFLKNYTEQYSLKERKQGAHMVKTMLTRLDIDEGGYHRELWLRSYQLRTHFSIEEMARKYSMLYIESSETKRGVFSTVRESVG